MLAARKEGETEEYHKGLIKDFLANTWYNTDYAVNTKGRIDLAIYNGNTAEAKPAVLIEVKAPGNRNEMFSPERPNVKALQEVVLYFMEEYITHGNKEIKHILITNFDEWYIFDAKDFARFFAVKSNPVYDEYQKFASERLTDTRTAWFYENIAQPAISRLLETTPISVVHFRPADFAQPADDSAANFRKLLTLYKFLSPETLLNKPFANDSNSLDRNFYAELLHIIGLEEVKDKGKKLIQRKAAKNRDAASFLESAIYQLQMDIQDERECFETALRLCITWINRLLFLKLLEAQVQVYRKGDKDYLFLNSESIRNNDELNIFFFKVLGTRIENRDEAVLKKYPNVPYLNSSLFEPTEDERLLKVCGIPDAQMEIFPKTVLKDERGRRAKGTLRNLDYIFKFLDAYDFASDAQGGVTSTSKALINASVLGLIFEKINGYKDGSFFTPGFITDYIAKETLERTVVQKFNEAKNWKCKTLADVKNEIEDRKEANEIVNGVRICDPAVGSGHFLVSALNRMLCIKSDLDILQDAEGQRIRRADYELRVEGDELSLLDDDGIPFEYKPGNPERSRIQEALFNEKRTIIENCLFGVDLNPNSVNICRLRLWIELLKNAYYTKESGYTRLETLPNIDINIKVGDSLLSYYPVLKGRALLDYLDRDEKSSKAKNSLAERLREYRASVREYKEGGSNFSKANLRLKIAGLKSLLKKHPDVDLWGNTDTTQTIDYTNSLEWAFEFPEVLDGSGKFIGFDAVIGNPPYVQLQEMGKMSDVYASKNYACYNKGADLYCLFVERGYSLLKENGFMSMIIPNKWMLVDYGEQLRTFMTQMSLKKLFNFGDIQFFDDAATYVCIFVAEQSKAKNDVSVLSLNQKTFKGNFSSEVQAAQFNMPAESFGQGKWVIQKSEFKEILEKMNAGTALKNLPITINYGIKTGLNDAFFIDDKKKDELIAEDPKSAELIKPMLRGRDVTAWHVRQNNENLIATYPSLHLNIDNYPAIKKHLLSFGIEKLEQTGIEREINGVKVKARKKTVNKWFETQDSISYYKEFAKPKIMYPNMTSVFPFIYDEARYVGNDKTFIITANDDSISLKFLTAVFNSKLAKYWIWYTCPELQGGTREIRKTYFEKFTVPMDNPEAQTQLATLADQVIAAKTADPKADTSAIEEQINTLVYKAYGLSEEEIKIVEGK